MNFPWPVVLVLGVAACGASSSPKASYPLPGASAQACGPRVLSRLYFGLGSPEGPIAPAAFQAFVDEVVTPRFPDGLTLLAADGQWRGKEGKTEREGSRVLELVHEASAEVDQKLVQIVTLYKQRFHQESVLVVRHEATACFAAAKAPALLR